MTWTVALALRPLGHGKSRLSPALTREERAELALAMAQDVIAAAVGTPDVSRVVVVTPDHHLADLLGDDATVLRERRASGLNEAYLRARQWVGSRPLALVAADLPQLCPDDLGAAFAAADELGRPVLVSDCEGVGTTLLAAARAARLRPRFGAGSRALHVADGAVDLSEQSRATIRHDVDTLAALLALRESRAVGEQTARWLDRRAGQLAAERLPCLRCTPVQRLRTSGLVASPGR